MLTIFILPLRWGGAGVVMVGWTRAGLVPDPSSGSGTEDIEGRRYPMCRDTCVGLIRSKKKD